MSYQLNRYKNERYGLPFQKLWCMFHGTTIEFVTPESHCYLGCTSERGLFVFQIATGNSNNMAELHRLYK